MRRFLPPAMLALLAVAVASPVNAGYLIIRVILDGGVPGNPGGDTPTAPMGGTPGGRPSLGGPMGSGLGPPGGLPASGGTPGTPGSTPGAHGTTGTHDPTRSLFVVVPIEEDLSIESAFYPGNVNSNTNPKWVKLRYPHRGDRLITNLFTDKSSIQAYHDLIKTPAFNRTSALDIRDKHTKWLKTKADPRVLFDTLISALAVGMVDDAMTYADELLAFAKVNQGLPADVADFTRIYLGIQKGLKGSPQKASNAEDWRSRLNANSANVIGHYALISWDATDAEIRRRSLLLEENFKGFYLSHAVRGIALPLPEAPLVVVLAKQGKDVGWRDGMKLAHALDAPNWLPADGFYAAQHDLLVLSPERIDDLGLTWAAQTRQLYQEGVKRDDLLAGNGPKPLDATGEKGRKPEDVARLQTLALVERLVDDNAAVFAISREGTRQLLYATRQLPRHVVLPDWLAHGSVNYFARPKDPAFIAQPENKWLVTVATNTGYGTANFALQRYFRDLIDKKELHPNRASLLKNVITDAYFLGFRDPKDVHDPDPAKEDKSGISLNTGGKPPAGGGTNPPSGIPPVGGGSSPPPIGRPPMGEMPPMGGVTPAKSTEEDPLTILRSKQERLRIKAQATSWALYYYLAKEKPAELKQFVDELATLPRDLPISAEEVSATFYRAFKLDGTEAGLKKFADGWLDFVRTVAPVGHDIPLKEPAPPVAGTGTGGTGTGGNVVVPKGGN